MAKLSKKEGRLKRAKRTRMKIRNARTARLTVFRTPNHIYAQIITDEYSPELHGALGQSKVLASASTIDKEIRTGLSGTKTEKARIVGKAIAERAKSAGITKVAFDRSGYKYHGRIKALADAAREAGIDF